METDKKPVHRAIRLEESVAALCDIEQMFLKLERPDVFQAFTPKQRARYHNALQRLRDLIEQLANDTAQQQSAS